MEVRSMVKSSSSQPFKKNNGICHISTTSSTTKDLSVFCCPPIKVSQKTVAGRCLSMRIFPRRSFQIWRISLLLMNFYPRNNRLYQISRETLTDSQNGFLDLLINRASQFCMCNIQQFFFPLGSALQALSQLP